MKARGQERRLACLPVALGLERGRSASPRLMVAVLVVLVGQQKAFALEDALLLVD